MIFSVDRFWSDDVGEEAEVEGVSLVTKIFIPKSVVLEPRAARRVESSLDIHDRFAILRMIQTSWVAPPVFDLMASITIGRAKEIPVPPATARIFVGCVVRVDGRTPPPWGPFRITVVITGFPPFSASF